VCGIHGLTGRVFAGGTVSQKGVCGMHGFTEGCVWNARFHRRVCVECTVSSEWCVHNARFHRDGVCEMHDFSGMVLNVCFPISRTFSSQ